MKIPKNHKMRLKSIGHRHWFWKQIPNWAYGERYRFLNRDIAYLRNGEIITIRRGTNILWRKEME